ncbi:unnamed protein product [Moneuplotes crassus]|uniref:Uncharacterized protein n=1 Tax=Euplotes crassus TaxID=5936 RepID=A0AAD1U772_EUPCR|nr:unnamed protein product [Moneuplotes crassus]
MDPRRLFKLVKRISILCVCTEKPRTLLRSGCSSPAFRRLLPLSTKSWLEPCCYAASSSRSQRCSPRRLREGSFPRKSSCLQPRSESGSSLSSWSLLCTWFFSCCLSCCSKWKPSSWQARMGVQCPACRKASPCVSLGVSRSHRCGWLCFVYDTCLGPTKQLGSPEEHSSTGSESCKDRSH